MTKRKRLLPTYSIESKISNGSHVSIAGVDEVGRGTLAGPVMAAAVILPGPVPLKYRSIINDSKKLSVIQRNKAFKWLTTWCVSYGIGACTASEIDAIGILPATKLSMTRAIAKLDPQPDNLIIDAIELSALKIPQTVMTRADSISQSVAAASIIAKVTRDQLMSEVFEEDYPGYGFASHKGYGTAFHMNALIKKGACRIHRRSFKPVMKVLGQSE